MLTDIEEAEYDRVMSVNVKGVFLGLKHVIKVMEKQGYGSIINTASTAEFGLNTALRHIPRVSML